MLGAQLHAGRTPCELRLFALRPLNDTAWRIAALTSGVQYGFSCRFPEVRRGYPRNLWLGDLLSGRGQSAYGWTESALLGPNTVKYASFRSFLRTLCLAGDKMF